MTDRRPSIKLKSGGFWYFDDPWSSKFSVEDIAHNLSKEARFNGANDSDLAYSVAQHAVNASYIAPPGFEWEALHHDDAEFAYKDLTTWLKGLCPDYKHELARGEAVLAKAFGLPETMSPEVKLADYQMLKMEKVALFASHTEDVEGFYHIEGVNVVGLDRFVDLRPWPAKMAKERWLLRYKKLEALR